MIQTIMISTVFLGFGGSGDGLSLPTHSTPPQTPVLTRSIKIGNTALQEEGGNKPLGESLQYFAQRQSSRPPGESHSGRASASPAGKVPESKRESGRNVDPSEPPSPREYDITSEQKPQEPMVTPQKGGDPLEGGGKSQPPFKRRGGVVE